MKLQTASETLSFLDQLQKQATDYYQTIIDRFGKDEEVYKGFIKENKRYYSDIMFSYRSVISDALEGCYAFNLNSDDWILDTNLPDNQSYKDAISKAVSLEEKMISFYEAAAQQSAQLLADVPRAMLHIVKKIKQKRLPKLKSM